MARGRIEGAVRWGGGRPGAPVLAGAGTRERLRSGSRSSLGRGTGGGEVVTGMTTEALVQSPTLKQHLTAIRHAVGGPSPNLAVSAC